MWKRWRRLDGPGLEILELREDSAGFAARSVIVDAGEEPFGLRVDWRLDREWRSVSVDLVAMQGAQERRLRIRRIGDARWEIDGAVRADLDGCIEVDVSATPFCNGLALRQLKQEPGELIALYVLAPLLSVVPSRQRYERAGEHWRYVDLGAAKGFTALLEFDDDLIVRKYEGLFEAID